MLQQNLIGGGLLKTEQIKNKVRMQNALKKVQLGLSGDRLMVRQGGGFIDFTEFLSRKGYF